MENKTSKYFRYAIGEIVLVVIGILIALQINNWNENRKQALSENEFLTGIKNDLQQDKKYIDDIVMMANKKIIAYQQLNEEISKNKQDSLLKLYLFKGQRTFYPISGSFESAVAGNEINTYKNKEITRPLIKLYNSTYSRLIDNAAIVDERWNSLSQKYSHERRVNSFGNINSSEISEILDDIHFHFIQLKWYRNTLNNALSEIDNLLIKLND